MDSEDLQISGCWHYTAFDSLSARAYLPQVGLKLHSTILSSLTRSTITQTFFEPNDKDIEEVMYSFPLYDDVSVIAFKCTIGDRTIHGLVKEREEAKQEFSDTIIQRETPAFLEQPQRSLDTLTTSLGMVPRGSTIVVEISYIGELQHYVGEDQIRFTIPMLVYPRYRPDLETASSPSHNSTIPEGDLDITVDVKLERQTEILELSSPSHPATDLKIGEISAINTHGARTEPNHASAVLKVPPEMHGGHHLESDFVLIVKTLGQRGSFAFMESHPDIPNQRAIMASIMPDFNLSQDGTSEVVFIIDQSGNMWDKILILQSILARFIRRLPVGINFNICSFGSYHRFMWPRSQAYNASHIHTVMRYIETIQRNISGTVIIDSIRAAVENRFRDLDLNVVLLTDGEIWNEKELLGYVSETASKRPVRFFPMGISERVSPYLMEGIAHVGNGFAQNFTNNEPLSNKVDRIVRAVLTPCIKNYTAEIQFDHSGKADGIGSVIVEKVNNIETMPDDPTGGSWTYINKQERDSKGAQLLEPILEETDVTPRNGAFALATPKILQTPYKMPALYPFMRTNIYFLLSPEACHDKPMAITMKFKSKHGMLDMTIPAQNVGKGVHIHQQAVRKATQELDEGRGWVFHVKDKRGKNFMDRHESLKEGIIKSEGVRLGTTFQVGCKWCPFVAINPAHEVIDFLRNETQRIFGGWPLYPSAGYAYYTGWIPGGIYDSSFPDTYAIDHRTCMPSDTLRAPISDDLRTYLQRNPLPPLPPFWLYRQVN